MSAIVNEPVTMSVPSISFVDRREAARLLDNKDPEAERICGVSQHFEGAFDTEAILMFPEDKSLEIVRLMVGEAVPLKERRWNRRPCARSATSCSIPASARWPTSSSASCMARCRSTTSAPAMKSSPPRAARPIRGADAAHRLRAGAHQIHGYVAFVLDVSALHDLKEQINRYIARAMGQE
jgi:chemotaxis protein CheC